MNNNYYIEGVSEQVVPDLWKDNYENRNFDNCKKTMNDMVLESGNYDPSTTALIYFNTKISNAEFQERIRKAAISFQNMGIKKDDVVYLFLLNTPEAIVSIYALNLIGAVPEYFNMVGIKPEKVKEDLNKYNVKYMITSDIFYDAYKDIINDTCCEKVVVNSLRDSMDKFTEAMYMTQLFTLDKAMQLAQMEIIQKFKKLAEKMNKIDEYCRESKADRKYSFHKNRLENDKIITWEEMHDTYYKDQEVKKAEYEDGRMTQIYHTGGTTGMYKYISATDFNMNAQTQMLSKVNDIELQPNTTYLQVIPPMVSLSISALHTGFVNNCTTVLVPAYEKDKYADLVLKYKPNTLVCVPQFLKSFIDNPKFDGKDLSFIHDICNGGEGMTAEEDKAIDDLLESHGGKRVNLYGFGQNEYCGAFSANSAMGETEKLYGSVGYPLRGGKIVILDPVTKKILGNTKDAEGNYPVGSIYLTGPSLTPGYIREDEFRNKERRIEFNGEVFFDTGDMGHLDEQGRLFYDTRIERIIRKDGGSKVFVTPLENRIKLMKEVKEVCIVPVTFEGASKQLICHVILNDKLNFLPKEDRDIVIEKVIKDMEEMILKEFHDFYLPTAYRFPTKDFELTPFGKINFRLLEQKEQEEYDNSLSENKEYVKIR